MSYTFEDSRKREHQNNSEEKAILGAAVAGTVVCSSFGSIEIFNESAQKLFGYRLDEVIGNTLPTLFSNESGIQLQSVLSVMGSSTKNFGENLLLQGKRKNKTFFPCQLRISVSVIDEKNIISCFMTDITSDHEHDKILQSEKKKSEQLLLSIFPESIAHKLGNGETFIANSHEDATCLFSDLVGFVQASSSMSAVELVQTLNLIINGFDSLVLKFGVEKIKTVGEKYFAASGLHVRAGEDDNHEFRMLNFGMEMFSVVYYFNIENNRDFSLRVGLHCGTLVSGVIGKLKYLYDVWGDVSIYFN